MYTHTKTLDAAAVLIQCAHSAHSLWLTVQCGLHTIIQLTTRVRQENLSPLYVFNFRKAYIVVGDSSKYSLSSSMFSFLSAIIRGRIEKFKIKNGRRTNNGRLGSLRRLTALKQETGVFFFFFLFLRMCRDLNLLHTGKE